MILSRYFRSEEVAELKKGNYSVVPLAELQPFSKVGTLSAHR